MATEPVRKWRWLHLLNCVIRLVCEVTGKINALVSNYYQLFDNQCGQETSDELWTDIAPELIASVFLYI